MYHEGFVLRFVSLVNVLSELPVVEFDEFTMCISK